MVASVRDLTKQSGFVFEGAVRRVGEVTSPGVEATPSTVVVHVEKVLKGPRVLSRFAGREITVVSPEHAAGEHAGTPPKTRAVFFTNPFHYGEGLGVRELGRHDAAGRKWSERYVKP